MTTKAAVRPVRATYRGLFGRGEFRALFTAQVVSMLGTMVAEVALTVLVFQRTGSPALSALTFTVGFLPYLFGGALLGGLVDRGSARRTMVICDVLSAVVFALMALPGVPVAGLLGLAFTGGLVAPVFAGTRAALLPQLLGSGSTYVLGRGAMRMVSQGAQVIGFGIGGLLLGLVGARNALLLDAGSFVASALVVRCGIGAHKPEGASLSRAGDSLVRDSLTGVRAVFAHRRTRQLLLFRWSLPTCAVAPEALAVPYIHALHIPQHNIGFYFAAMPLATVIGDLVVARLMGSSASPRLIALGAVLSVVPMVGFFAMPGLVVAVALLFAMGLGSWQSLALDVLMLRTVPEGLQSRALAVDQAGLMFMQGLGFGLWGLLGQLLPLRVAVGIAGLCGVGFVLAWLYSTRRSADIGMQRSSHAMDRAHPESD